MSQPSSPLPRVIIVAENATDKFGGEAILPLHYFRFLRSRDVEVWLVVHERTRKDLSISFGAEDQKRIHYIPDTFIHRALWNTGKILPRQISKIAIGFPMHLLTQHLQRNIVRKLVRDNNVDIVHEPTPVSPKQPSLMFNVGAPVIIGPMNGGMTFPPAFRSMDSVIERAFVHVGRGSSGLINRIIRGKHKAKLLLVANERTKKALPKGINTRVIQLVENGVDLELWKTKSIPKTVNLDEPIRFLYLGSLIPLKAVDILFEALSLMSSNANSTNFRLDIIGKGSEQSKLEKLAIDFKIDHLIHFYGYLPQVECAEHLEQCAALVLSSLHECGGAVVLEAMAMGKPVIATDWGGPADYLDESCGILISPDSREDLVNGFADAMKKLANSKDLREQLGKTGREKVLQEFDWQRKIDQILDIYKSILRTNKAHR